MSHLLATCPVSLEDDEDDAFSPPLSSGAVCCVCVLVDDVLHVASTGDCRALVIDTFGRFKFLTTDHVTDNLHELKRLGITSRLRADTGGYLGGLQVSAVGLLLL